MTANYYFEITTDTTDIEVQLVRGIVPGEGYVQTRCPSSNWTTLCSDDWDSRDANVVCKELGFAFAYGTNPKGLPVGEFGDIIVNDVYCSGEEKALRDCRLENVDSMCNNIFGVSAAQCAESKF